jgi:gamma-glutamyltranspeptidase/glutathione hydrolase
MILGSPGGSTIPTTVFQIIVNVIGYKMNLADAVSAGRFHHQWLPDWIAYEENSIDSITVAALKQMGHELRSRIAIGRVNAIQVMENGMRTGCADIRGGNSSCGY